MSLAGNNARIFLDDLDLSCNTSALEVAITTTEGDVTTLCSTATESIPIVTSGKITVNGFFKGVLTGEEYKLNAALAAQNKAVAAIFDYSSLPAVAYCIEQAGNVGMDYSFPVNGVAAMSGNFSGKGGMKRGSLNYYKTTISATGLAAVTQVPGTLTSSSGKIFAFLHTINGTAATPITFAVQSSVNGSGGWTNEATFSMSAIGSSVQSFTTPLGAYFTINTTSMGGATSFVLSLIICVDGVTT